MRKIILSQPFCPKCKQLSALCPDVEVIELDQAQLLALARALDIRSLPIVVLSGEQEEMKRAINGEPNGD